jgi:uncharacterized protein
MIALCRKHETVYVDSSAYTTKRIPPEILGYMKTTSGPREVMSATNYPMIPPDKPLEDLNAFGLDEDACAPVPWPGTAARIRAPSRRYL